ncbi:MAG: hypothetical protein R2747_15145 [Pyrinomonadaceae bacterium]
MKKLESEPFWQANTGIIELKKNSRGEGFVALWSPASNWEPDAPLGASGIFLFDPGFFKKHFRPLPASKKPPAEPAVISFAPAFRVRIFL